MNEFYSIPELISQDLWSEKIRSLRPVAESSDSEVILAKDIKRLVEDAVKFRLEGLDHFGICFSGGLDSGLIAAIAKKQKSDFTCYTVGFQDGNFKDPDDVIEAQKVAKFLKLSDDEFKFKIFDIKEIEAIIKKTAKILKSNANVVNTGVGAVELASYSISNKEKFFFSGLGSEEIFAGYDRHKKNPTNEECFQGLLNMYERDLVRDFAISKELNFSFKTPFLDEKLIRYSLAIPIRFKVNDHGSKIILRRAAFDYLGIHSDRPKKAAQYGSSFDRALGKLASLKGYKLKKDYLNSIII